MIKDITAKAELNKIYSGKVMKIMEFGAFVNFLGKQDGLVHISELADKRVAKVTDVVKEGDEVKVKVIGFDRGKVKLSIESFTLPLSKPITLTFTSSPSLTTSVTLATLLSASSEI